MSSNLILFPKARREAKLCQQMPVSLSLKMSDGTELRGEVRLKEGQSPRALLQDDRGFIALRCTDGITHIVSTELVDALCLLPADEKPFPAA